MGKYASRKFISVILNMLMLIVIPILFQKIGVSESVTMMVLGGLSTLSTIYLGANVMAKKYTGIE